METAKFIVKASITYNGVHLEKGTVLTVMNTKVNENGLYRYLSNRIGWINDNNPMMNKLEEMK